MQNPSVGEKQVPEKPGQNRYSNINKINTNKEIDNIDKIDKSKKLKTFEKNITHSILTKELIKKHYIESDDEMSSFKFDNLFNNYLADGRSYQELFSSIHYIVSRVVDRNFIDEKGNEITNRYGYFKSALESNLNNLDNLGKDRAWYDQMIDLSTLPKGNYAIYISTTSNITDYSELIEVLNRDLSKLTATISNKKYSFSINKDSRYRIELMIQ